MTDKKVKKKVKPFRKNEVFPVKGKHIALLMAAIGAGIGVKKIIIPEISRMLREREIDKREMEEMMIEIKRREEMKALKDKADEETRRLEDERAALEAKRLEEEAKRIEEEKLLLEAQKLEEERDIKAKLEAKRLEDAKRLEEEARLKAILEAEKMANDIKRLEQENLARIKEESIEYLYDNFLKMKVNVSGPYEEDVCLGYKNYIAFMDKICKYAFSKDAKTRCLNRNVKDYDINVSKIDAAFKKLNCKSV